MPQPPTQILSANPDEEEESKPNIKPRDYLTPTLGLGLLGGGALTGLSAQSLGKSLISDADEPVVRNYLNTSQNWSKPETDLRDIGRQYADQASNYARIQPMGRPSWEIMKLIRSTPLVPPQYAWQEGNADPNENSITHYQQTAKDPTSAYLHHIRELGSNLNLFQLQNTFNKYKGNLTPEIINKEVIPQFNNKNPNVNPIINNESSQPEMHYVRQPNTANSIQNIFRDTNNHIPPASDTNRLDSDTIDGVSNSVRELANQQAKLRYNTDLDKLTPEQSHNILMGDAKNPSLDNLLKNTNPQVWKNKQWVDFNLGLKSKEYNDFYGNMGKMVLGLKHYGLALGVPMTAAGVVVLGKYLYDQLKPKQENEKVAADLAHNGSMNIPKHLIQKALSLNLHKTPKNQVMPYNSGRRMVKPIEKTSAEKDITRSSIPLSGSVRAPGGRSALVGNKHNPVKGRTLAHLTGRKVRQMWIGGGSPIEKISSLFPEKKKNNNFDFTPAIAGGLGVLGLSALYGGSKSNPTTTTNTPQTPQTPPIPHAMPSRLYTQVGPPPITENVGTPANHNNIISRTASGALLGDVGISYGVTPIVRRVLGYKGPGLHQAIESAGGAVAKGLGFEAAKPAETLLSRIPVLGRFAKPMGYVNPAIGAAGQLLNWDPDAKAHISNSYIRNNSFAPDRRSLFEANEAFNNASKSPLLSLNRLGYNTLGTLKSVETPLSNSVVQSVMMGNPVPYATGVAMDQVQSGRRAWDDKGFDRQIAEQGNRAVDYNNWDPSKSAIENVMATPGGSGSIIANIGALNDRSDEARDAVNSVFNPIDKGNIFSSSYNPQTTPDKALTDKVTSSLATSSNSNFKMIPKANGQGYIYQYTDGTTVPTHPDIIEGLYPITKGTGEVDPLSTTPQPRPDMIVDRRLSSLLRGSNAPQRLADFKTQMPEYISKQFFSPDAVIGLFQHGGFNARNVKILTEAGVLTPDLAQQIKAFYPQWDIAKAPNVTD